MPVLPRLAAPCGALCLLLAWSAGSGAAPRPTTDYPSIETPRIHAPLLPAPSDAKLPHGARAVLSRQDMEPVLVVIPPRPAASVPVEDVLREVVSPLLDKMRFEGGLKRLQWPPLDSQGSAPRGAKLAQLADMVKAGVRGQDPRVVRRAEELLAIARDMPAAAPGRTDPRYEAFMRVRDIERPRIHYRFAQLHEGVPVEHTMLVATRRGGETVSIVQGTLIREPVATNKRPDPPATPPSQQAVDAIVARAYAALAAVEGIDAVDGKDVRQGPVLVALPYGNVGGPGPQRDRIALRYSWRMILTCLVRRRPVPFLAWIDAEDGTLLKLVPLAAGADGLVKAQGGIWRRDPGVGIVPREFWVDDDSAFYVLKHKLFSGRVEFGMGGSAGDDVSLPVVNPPFADFNQPPINDADQALCSSGTNRKFQQVQVFALMYQHWNDVLAAGALAGTFPHDHWTFHVETEDCDAGSTLYFGVCGGYTAANCPNHSVPTGDKYDNHMNYAHDGTVVSHELGHTVADHLQSMPPAWCGLPSCALPGGWERLHDLADAWSDHFENTNCTGGWVAKNMGGKDHSYYCTGNPGHTEGRALPRLHEVTVPLDVNHPGDHFPEHRVADSTDGYADGQIAAAALWQVREGMGSIDPLGGYADYFKRYLHALAEAGWVGADLGDTDMAIYQYLALLERHLVQQWWASSTSNTTNKVLAGFAKTGIFAIPPACLDDDASTNDTQVCPSGTNGGDAVVDVDDNDLSDDVTQDNVLHADHDHLKRNGPPPVFHVWTGPRYRFSGDAATLYQQPAPCNSKFIVDLSTDEQFTGPSTAKRASSGWISVNVDNGTAAKPNAKAQCYGTWTPDARTWGLFKNGTRVYYRARTADASGGNVRDSTLPMAGTWTVPPPYAVITSDGRPAP